MSHNAGLTRAIVFEEAHEQGQRFAQVVDCLDPEVDFSGTGLEGPNGLDVIGTHQRGGGSVEVGLDLQIGAG